MMEQIVAENSMRLSAGVVYNPAIDLIQKLLAFTRRAVARVDWRQSSVCFKRRLAGNMVCSFICNKGICLRLLTVKCSS